MTQREELCMSSTRNKESRRLSRQTRIIASLKTELELLLDSTGFSKSEETVVRELRKVEWCRDCSWRTETVTLGHSLGYSYRLFISVRTLLPVPFEELQTSRFYMDGIGVFYTCHLPFALPGLALRRDIRFVRKVVQAVSESLPWFTQFEKPQTCLDRLIASGRARAPHVALAIEYLQNVIESNGESE